MALESLVSAWKNRAKPVKQSLETLAAIVVPKKIFSDKSYREQPWGVKKEAGRYFDTCAMDIARAFFNVYGGSFQVDPHPLESRGVKYTIHNATATCIYSVQGAEGAHTDTFRSWINDVMAIVQLQQPTFLPEQQKLFLEGVLKSHMLDYRRETFGVFYNGNNREVKREGLALLRELGVKPLEAAQYEGAMGFGQYKAKQFTPKELTQLFPEPIKQ